YFNERLPEALEKYPRVIVLTHIAPWRETCFYEGRTVDDQRAPWFVQQHAGEIIAGAAARYPRRHITVLQGHAHGKQLVHLRDNLVVYVGQKQPGRPTVEALLDVE